MYRRLLGYLQNNCSAFQRFWKKLRIFRVSIDKIIFKPKRVHINVGGGRFYKRGWKVLDFRTPWYQIPPQYIDFNFDLMSLNQLPFPDNSVQLFYSEHVLEHLPDQQCEHVLKEFHRCLDDIGAIRIVVPDIDLAYQATEKDDKEFFLRIDEEYRQFETVEECLVNMFAGYFVRTDHNLDIQESAESIRNNFHTMAKHDFLNKYSQQIRNYLTPAIQHRYGGIHINWWNREKLSSMLRRVGFQNVYITEPQKSRFPAMRGMRFDTRPFWSLHMEAIKEKPE